MSQGFPKIQYRRDLPKRGLNGYGLFAAGTAVLLGGFVVMGMQNRHTRALTQYFLDGRVNQDISVTNPIGCGGKLAREYEALVQQLWEGTAKVVSPRDFKYAISRFAPQFAGTFICFKWF